MATMQDKTIRISLPFLFQFFFLLVNFMVSIEISNAHVHDLHENMDMVDDMKNYFPLSSYGHGTQSFDGMEDEAWGMVEKKGNQFVVGGQPFYFNGFNTYWLMIFAVDQSTQRKVTEVFQEALSVGYTVCRTWAFNDGGWRALQKSPSVYDEEVFKVICYSTCIKGAPINCMDTKIRCQY